MTLDEDTGKGGLDQKMAEAVRLLVDFLDGYFNIEYHGISHIPAGSRFVWTHNHCGWPSLDALVIGKKIYEYTEEKTGHGEASLAFWHDLVAKAPYLKHLVRGLNGISINDIPHYKNWHDHSVFATPAEGEAGSFRSSFTDPYKLYPFRSGIGRIACLGQAEFILPVSILGPSESFPLLGRFKVPVKGMLDRLSFLPGMEEWADRLRNFSHKDLIIPLLLPLQGLPISWYVRFHKPVAIADLVAQSDPAIFDRRLYLEIAQRARQSIEDDLRMQAKLRERFRFTMPHLSGAIRKRLRRKFYRGINFYEQLWDKPSSKENWSGPDGTHEEPSREPEHMAKVIPFPRTG